MRPYCLVAVVRSLIHLAALLVTTGALRNVDLVADEENQVYKLTRCECDFGDNYWFTLLSSLTKRRAACSVDEEPLVNCPEHLLVMKGQRGRAFSTDEADLHSLATADRLGDIEAKLILFELCLPGQLAKNLYCARHATAAEDHGAAYMHLVHGRRLLPLVARCLSSSLWPFRAPRLVRALRSARGLCSLHITRYRVIWPSIMQRCVPLARECWPEVAGVPGESCELCCDADANSANEECQARFRDNLEQSGWGEDKCCKLPVVSTTTTTSQMPVLPLWQAAPDEELSKLRAALRGGCEHRRTGSIAESQAEVSDQQQCSSIRQVSPPEERFRPSNATAEAEAPPSSFAFDAWLRRARMPSASGQRVFAREDLFLTRHACVDIARAHDAVGPAQKRGLSWFAALPRRRHRLVGSRASGIHVAADHGGLCGGGTIVGAEWSGSTLARDVVVPCPSKAASVAGQGGHAESYVMESYALELMAPQAYEASLARARGGSRGSGIVVLLGEVPHNPGHWVHLAIWLYKLATGSSLPLLRHAFPGPLTLAQTKYAAAQCDPAGVFCSPRSLDLQRMPYAWLLLQPALDAFKQRGVRVAWMDLLANVSGAQSPMCFALSLQPWREWPGDAPVYDHWRLSLSKMCGFEVDKIPDNTLPRRALAVERTSRYRSWHPETRRELQDALTLWGRVANISVTWAHLGKLPPCEQIRLVASSSMLFGIAGAETAHAAFLPRGGALVEVDPFCAAGTMVRNGAASGLDASELEKLNASRCCKSNFALGRENCAPSRAFPEMEAGWRWRGPGLVFRGETWSSAARLWAQRFSAGRCKWPVGTEALTACAGGPSRRWTAQGRWSELARLRGLVYISLARCTCEAEKGSGADCMHLFRHGSLRVRVWEDVLPLFFALYEEYLRPRMSV